MTKRRTNEATDDGWELILDPGERVIWQGRPDGKLAIAPNGIQGVLMGLFVTGFAIFWMNGASAGGGFFWVFGLLPFFAGLGIAANNLFGNVVMRRFSWYTLTDRRAFIGRDLPVLTRSLKSYPIGPGTRLEFEDGDLGTIWFAEEHRRTKNGSRKLKIGFERIPDARAVYAQIRAVQRGEA